MRLIVLKSFKHWVDVGLRITVLMRCAHGYQISIWPAQDLLGLGVITSFMIGTCLQFTAYFIFVVFQVFILKYLCS